MDAIVERIIAELKEQKKSQLELARFIGVTQNVVTDWKSGRIKSYTRYIHGIADFLGVSVEYLRGETDQKEKPPVRMDEGQDANMIRIAGRDGSYQERRLTDEQLDIIRRMVDQMPDFKD